MNPSDKIDSKINSLIGWQKDKCARIREIIHEVDSEITEDWKWETPIFSKNGMICALGTFKDHVKINFFKGAKLKDPKGVINNGLTSKSHRSIDFKENDVLDEAALKEMILDAVSLNK